MKAKSKEILRELIRNGHKFTGYTVQEVKEALQDAVDSDPIRCGECVNWKKESEYLECKVTAETETCPFAERKEE